MPVIRAIAAALLLVASSIAMAKPKISLSEAIRLAEAYVSTKKIPNSKRFLAGVNWHEDLKRPEKSCWAIQWAPNQPGILDAQLIVWVCDNGMISHQDSWA